MLSRAEIERLEQTANGTDETLAAGAKVNQRACEMLGKVFESYVADPGQLGEVATKRIEQEGLHRTVCDYVAGMTDRYLIEEYARITGERAALL